MKKVLTLALFLAFFAGLPALFLTTSTVDQTVSNGSALPAASISFGDLPLSFEANSGQTDPAVRYLARGKGYSLFLTDDEAVLSLRSPRCDSDTAPNVIRMSLAGAHASYPAGADEQHGRTNYFSGRDPSNWHTDVARYSRVRYEDVYPGIDQVYYGNQGQLEYDFIVAPGADHEQVRLKFDGVSNIDIDESTGELVLGLDGSHEVRQKKPLVYQEANGQREFIAANYVKQSNGDISFKVADYDHTRPLVIDPVLVYSTRFGGANFDIGEDIAIDAAGNMYILSTTFSDNFPTAGAIQPVRAGNTDAAVTKINAAGNAIVYSTYLGGSKGDSPRSIAVDAAGNVFVTGFTISTDFPVASAVQPVFGGFSDGFVTKINPSGSALVFSTYLGGSFDELPLGIDVDSSGNAVISGTTSSPNFPTAAAFQPVIGPGGQSDAFVTKINSAGTALVFSTFLGTAGDEYGGPVALDSSGNIYLPGITNADNFPVTANAPQSTRSGLYDAFVTKFNSSASAITYSTYLGGADEENVSGMAVDSLGNAVVTGQTSSSNFPTASAFQPSAAGGVDMFVSKINAAGTAFVYSTYFGGSADDEFPAVAVDQAGSTYISGSTASANFPLLTPLQSVRKGTTDACAAKFGPAGQLVYSTYFGGTGAEDANGAAVDSAGNFYFTGFTSSVDYPAVNPLESEPLGSSDAIVAKISSAAAPSPTATPTSTPTATPTSTPTPPASIAGTVTYGTTPTGQPVRPVPGVGLTAAGSQQLSTTTSSNGAYALTGFGSGPYTVTPTKSGDINSSISGLDAARVAQHVAGLIALTPNQQIAGDATNNGSLSGLDAARIAQFAAGLTNPGVAGQWKFLPASRTYGSVTGALSSENYEAILVGEVTGNWTPAAPRPGGDGQIAEPSASEQPDAFDGLMLSNSPSDAIELVLDAARKDDTTDLIIPIRISDTTGKGLVAYDFTVVFDSGELTPVQIPVDADETLSQRWTVVHNDLTPGVLRVTAFGTTALAGKGVLLNLKFNGRPGVKTRTAGITLDAFQLNEDEINVRNGPHTQNRYRFVPSSIFLRNDQAPSAFLRFQ